jgi:formylglycine-generating enzyme required for sulfatase activity
MFKDHIYTETAVPDCPFDMVQLPGGTFIMGATTDKNHPNYDPDARYDETLHEVTLNPFLIGKYPVTQRLWMAVMGNNPSYFQENGEEKPVEQMSWDDIQDFLKKLHQYTHKKYCLPTEAQWEYAARGGNPTPFRYAGSDDLSKIAWSSDNSGLNTYPGGLLLSNEYGIYDLSGNVWEWCADWYGEYEKAPKLNPAGPRKGDSRVTRGGSGGNEPQFCRAALRNNFKPSDRNILIGFRLILQSVDNHPR